MPLYEYDKDYPFATFVTNLGKCNEGELVGEWVKFPTTANEIKAVFDRIGIGQKDDFGCPYEEWFITDYDCYVDGLYDNWRNSIYIECKPCKYEPHEGCGDYLCVPDENGTPVMLPICDCKILFTRYIDPSECLLWISHLRFNEIYSAWIKANRTNPDKCPFITGNT